MVRRSRALTAAAAKKSSTPLADSSDEETFGGPTPTQRNESEIDEENDAEINEDDDQATPQIESDTGSRPTTPARGRASKIRTRRAGRSARGGVKRRDLTEEAESRDGGSDAGTPRKRGGWRGRGFGGGRWAKPRGGPSHITQVPLDKLGNMANVKDDEIELPLDEEGETKVDKNGVLKGGRKYRVRTFPIAGKGLRLFMLSTEPARCIGFRDSYLFFQKHPQLFKIILDDDAKKDIIDREIIPHSYKGRAIGVVTARSVFREFGARIIIGGRKIIDDYQVAAVRVQGDLEGELANPEDPLPNGGDEYDMNQYVAWHGASSVYHSGASSVPVPNGKAVEGKKRKVIVTGANWMFEHAREACRLNSSLAASRRQNLNGIYDVHTNTMQYPKIMQPTHARWEQIVPSSAKANFRRGIADENATDGIEDMVDSNNTRYQANDSIFPDVSAVFTRNFLVSDTYYTAPSSSTLGYPGHDQDLLDLGPGGLTHIPEHMLVALPDECRQSFNHAREEEMKWKESWRTEKDDRTRAQLRITYNN